MQSKMKPTTEKKAPNLDRGRCCVLTIVSLTMWSDNIYDMEVVSISLTTESIIYSASENAMKFVGQTDRLSHFKALELLANKQRKFFACHTQIRAEYISSESLLIDLTLPANFGDYKCWRVLNGRTINIHDGFIVKSLELNWMKMKQKSKSFALCSSSLVRIFMFITLFRSPEIHFSFTSVLETQRERMSANTILEWKTAATKCAATKVLSFIFQWFRLAHHYIVVSRVLFFPPSFAFFHSIVHDHWWSFRCPFFISHSFSTNSIYCCSLAFCFRRSIRPKYLKIVMGHFLINLLFRSCCALLHCHKCT